MGLLKRLWNDERGAVVTAELAMLGTVGVVGGLVGLNVAAKAVNEELADVAFAFRSLDQSYAYNGQTNHHARVAGSTYVQQDVQTSLDELCGIDELQPGKHPGAKDERRGHEHRGHEHRGERHDRAHEHRRDDRKPMLVPKKRKTSEPGRDEVDAELNELRAARYSGRHQV